MVLLTSADKGEGWGGLRCPITKAAIPLPPQAALPLWLPRSIFPVTQRQTSRTSGLLRHYSLSLSILTPMDNLPTVLLLSCPSRLFTGLPASSLPGPTEHTAAHSFPRSPGVAAHVLCATPSLTAHHQLLHLAVKASHIPDAPASWNDQHGTRWARPWLSCLAPSSPLSTPLPSPRLSLP